MNVSVQWALRSKPPGARTDYEILAHSAGAITRASFEQSIGRLITCALAPPERGNGSAPIIGIGARVTKAGTVGIGVLQRHFATHTDASGRTPEESRYFLFDYPELVAAAPTYRQLYQIIANVELPTDGSPLDRTLPSFDVRDIVQTVERVGFEQLALAAALMLERGVAIVGADVEGAEARLQILDAVVALLPYGYRARIAAATWMDPALEPPIRLGFAHHAAPGQVRLTWGSGHPERQPATEDGRRYAELLAFMAEKVGVEAMVTALVKETKPLARVEPGPALAILERIAAPHLLAERLATGHVSLADARAVVDGGAIATVPPKGREAMLEQLSASPELHDLRRLNTFATDQEIAPDLEWHALHSLTELSFGGDAGSLAGGTALDVCLEIAEARGTAVPLWQTLLTEADSPKHRHRATADSLFQYLMTRYENLTKCPPGLAGAILTAKRLARLLDDPEIAGHLPILLQHGPSLNEDAIAVLLPFLCVWEPPSEGSPRLTAAMLAQLAATHVTLPLRLLEVATARNTVNQVFAAFWEWQVTTPAGLLASFTDPRRANWRQALATVAVRDDLTPRTRARLDVLLLYADVYDNDLRQLWLLFDPSEQRDAYVKAFVTATFSPLLDRLRMLSSLRRAVMHLSWDHAVGMPGLLQLLTALAIQEWETQGRSQGSRPFTTAMASWLRQLLRNHAKIREQPLYQQHWQQLVEPPPPPPPPEPREGSESANGGVAAGKEPNSPISVPPPPLPAGDILVRFAERYAQEVITRKLTAPPSVLRVAARRGLLPDPDTILRLVREVDAAARKQLRHAAPDGDEYDIVLGAIAIADGIVGVVEQGTLGDHLRTAWIGRRGSYLVWRIERLAALATPELAGHLTRSDRAALAKAVQRLALTSRPAGRKRKRPPRPKT